MTENNTVDNKKIAKNTFFLYIRMFFVLALNLYISRAVLDVLGEVDFGIYNVVGGFVAMFGILSNSMTAATQRFLSYEIGKKEKGNVKSVFSTAVIIHIIFSIIVLVVAESVGLWFVENKLNYPDIRKTAVFWVYQFSVLTFIVGVLSVPYNAALIAFERMKAFAYVGVIEVVLKLIVVLCLQYSSLDQLILYGLLLALIAITIRFIYSIYVKINIPACKCDYKLNKEVRKKMVSFAGWNAIGSISNMLNNQGVNVLLNMFFGATVNAARGISYQVMNALQLFIMNFQLAMNPQIIKSFASGNKKEAFNLAFKGSRFSFMLLMIFVIPIILEAPTILNLWLVKVPDLSIAFLRIILFTALINSLGQTLSYLMHASGIVRNYQIVVGGSYVMAVPIIYIVFYFGGTPISAMIIVLLFSQVSQFCQLIMLKRSINLPVKNFIITVWMKSWGIFAIAFFIPLLLHLYMSKSYLTSLGIVIASLLCTCSVIYVWGVSIHEREYIIKYLVKIKNKIL
mgnify:CR=1 FL=1